MATEDPRDVGRMIAGMNTHMPAVRRTLLELSECESPSYRTRSGETIEIERSEIDYLLNECTEMEKMRIKLPIIVTTDISGEMPAWRVDGAAEAGIIARILQKPQFKADSVRFYNPDYQKIRKILPTSVIIAYLP